MKPQNEPTKLMTPPPVLSRVYQELSNGMLGFNQSLKLADVPFPFIFAQILEGGYVGERALDRENCGARSGRKEAGLAAC